MSSDPSHRGHRSLPVKWGSLHAGAARSTLGASIMDSSLGLNIFTVLFLSGTFLAALVAGLGGFAFGIVAAAVWLYILTPLRILDHGPRTYRTGLRGLEVAGCAALE